jgi:hypothetical protein
MVSEIVWRFGTHLVNITRTLVVREWLWVLNLDHHSARLGVHIALPKWYWHGPRGRAGQVVFVERALVVGMGRDGGFRSSAALAWT